ncbi:MAG: maleylpyruvate isomerase N-terminal domain-containing protein [Gemmatimonadaceae bacterium]|nr:maleylpyruvate isomerase N-terminal domain-containing protein [Gemmatimonadaceae bacterium]
MPSTTLPALGVTETSGLFAPLLRELLTLLRALSEDDWHRPTMAGSWRVRDVAAHLLDGELRKIAVYRDRHMLPMDSPIESDRDLTAFVNQVNASGVSFATRLSPRLITDLLEVTGEWVADVLSALPPHAPSIFAVSWAGESQSENWMDTGREYTERWHHQAQIRDAVGAAALLTPAWFVPLLDISVRALPVAYAGTDAVRGTAVVLHVTGETVASYSLVRDADRWTVWRGAAVSPTTAIRVSCADVWRLLYNAFDAPEASARLEITGDVSLASPLLHARSVIV